MTKSEMIRKMQDTFGLSYTAAKAYLEKHEWDILEAAIAYKRDTESGAPEKDSSAGAERPLNEDDSSGSEDVGDEKREAREEERRKERETREEERRKEREAREEERRKERETREEERRKEQETREEERRRSEERARERAERYRRNKEAFKEGGGRITEGVKDLYRKAQRHLLIISRGRETILTLKISTLFWLILLAALTVISLPFFLMIFLLSLFFGVNYRIEGPGHVDEINRIFDTVSRWVDRNLKDDQGGHRSDEEDRDR